MHRSNVLARWWATAGAVALVAGCVILAPAAALAAPSEPIMTLTALQSRLSASPDGTVSGYLKTVMQGTTISTIPVTVVDVASAQSAGLDGSGADSYIVFVATGPVIARLGAIAEGMSGSPIYVPDAGQDKLVGALSYGDYFSTDGSGLATPIESMMGLESAYPLFSPLSASTVALKSPVTVTLHAGAAKRLGERTFMGKPLDAVEIGGLPSTAPGVVAARKAMQARGVDLLVGSSGSGSGASSNVATLEAGASVAALAARGDVWWGGVGTVTYATTSTVVAFGHPLFWGGRSDLYMTNAWIDYTVPNAYVPYKMGAPTAVRGTVEQDRGVGILGAIGPAPHESTITASATDMDSSRTASSATYMPTPVLSSDDQEYFEIPYLATYAAGFNVEDRKNVTGSALTTTTVVVRDGARTFTVVRRDVWDTGAEDASYGDDLPTQLPGDVDMIVGDLQTLSDDGVAHPQILSVDLKSSISSSRASAQIADVTLPSALKVGANRVEILLDVWGVPDTQTVDATLTLPPGTALNGQITVYGGGGGFESTSTAGGGLDIGPSGPPETTAQGIDDISNTPRNSDIVIDYTPMASLVAPLTSAAVSSDMTEAIAPTSWFISGQTQKMTATVILDPSPSSLPYGGGTDIAGIVDEFGDTPGAVVIFGQAAGSSAVTTLAVAPVDDTGSFDAAIDGLTRNTLVTVRYLGDDYTLPGQTTKQLYVSAAVGLRASSSSVKHGAKATLSATVLPSDTSGSVVFEYLSGKTWRSLGTAPISAARAVLSWKVPKGKSTIRARYVGSINHGGTSKSITVTGK